GRAPIPSFQPRRSRQQPPVPGQGQGPPGRPGVPRPRGRVRAAGQARCPQEHRRRTQRGWLGREDPHGPGERLDDGVDVPGRAGGRRGRRREPRLHHAAEGPGRRPGQGAGHAADPDREGQRPGGRPDRHRGADRDGAGADQRQRHRLRQRAHRDDHLRAGRLHGQHQHEVAGGRRPAPGLPGRPLPLHPHADPHGRPRPGRAGDRRPVPAGARRAGVRGGRQALGDAGLRRQVGAAPGPDRRRQRDLRAVAGGLRPRRADPRRLRLGDVGGRRQEGLGDARRRDDRRGQPQDGPGHRRQGPRRRHGADVVLHPAGEL
ncbi:MAG: L-malyl-CoA/beta-methylmalyl-CoA lyase, actinobacterial type, partial [uncultured Blastococcus sp.]